MTNEEFLKIIEEIDAKLSKSQVPVYQRGFLVYSEIERITGDRAFMTDALGINYPPYVGSNLMRSISEWYSKRWGRKTYLPTTIGKIPILLRGELFISRIPLVFGVDVAIPILKTIDDMTDDLAHSLTEVEINEIKSAFHDGYNLIYEINDMAGVLGLNSTQNLDSELHTLFQNAIEDCNKAVQCLIERLDTNGSRFHSQQFAEKMLKGYIKNAGGKIGNTHKLKEKIFKKCMGIDNSFSEIEAEVDSLSTIDMSIRYDAPKSSLETAYKNFWNSLRIGGFCASKVSRSGRRFGT